MARLRASWRTSLPVVQQPRNPQSESIARTPYDSLVVGLARIVEGVHHVDDAGRVVDPDHEWLNRLEWRQRCNRAHAHDREKACDAGRNPSNKPGAVSGQEPVLFPGACIREVALEIPCLDHLGLLTRSV